MNNLTIWLLNTLTFLFQSCNQQQIKTAPLSEQQIISLYKKATGIEAKINELCIKKTTNLKGVVSVGSFAHDLGCLDGRVIVGERIGTVEEMTEKGLQLNGWNTGADQKALLLLWTRHVVLAWENPVLSSNIHFERKDTPVFTEPLVSFQNNQWSVRIWVQEPVGMFATADFYEAVVDYTESGRLIKIVKANHFSNQK